jgi:hypothetical protein
MDSKNVRIVRLGNVTYERISWGWLATTIYRGYLRRGRGETKKDALAALRNSIITDR